MRLRGNLPCDFLKLGHSVAEQTAARLGLEFYSCLQELARVVVLRKQKTREEDFKELLLCAGPTRRQALRQGKSEDEKDRIA
jgi:hypothetical protein